jgi:hypothetical protein
MRYLPSMKIKHNRQFDEPIHDLKKKKSSQNSKQKILPRSNMFFLATLYVSSPHQKKQFDTNFNCFYGRNQCQQKFSLSSTRFWWLSFTSFILNCQKIKKTSLRSKLIFLFDFWNWKDLISSSFMLKKYL